MRSGLRESLNMTLSLALSALLLFILILAPAPASAVDPPPSDLIGSDNSVDGTSGGGTTLSNPSPDTVDNIYGSYNTGTGSSGGENQISNAGTANGSIYGSYNIGSGSFGGGNQISNTGTVDGFIYGSYSTGTGSYGGYNEIHILQDTFVDEVYGSYGGSSGGSSGYNTITLEGDSYVNKLYGDYLTGSAQGGHNEITISSTGAADSEGYSAQLVYGSYNNSDGGDAGYNHIIVTGSGDILEVHGSRNEGTDSSGGYNEIDVSGSGSITNLIGSTNSGSGSSGGYNSIEVTGDGSISYLIGSENYGFSASGGGNTITNSGDGTITSLYGSMNLSAFTSGGSNTITNSGSGLVGVVYGSYNTGAFSSGGDNRIINSGEVSTNIVGSYNTGEGSSGGSNIITNSSGGIAGEIVGSLNQGIDTSGGSNIINNQSSGAVGSIVGSHNDYAGSTGGSNTINNTGSGLVGEIVGSGNTGIGSSGGSNTINNSGSGLVTTIFGSFNSGSNTSGGSNTINNTGNGIVVDICGSYNLGENSSSEGNTIYNSGTVIGSIYGSYNVGVNSRGGDDNITNIGTVGGGIYGADGNDTVTMQTGPESVGANIDGGDDTDTLIYSGGSWRCGNVGNVVNFELFAINATHDLILLGDWDIGGQSVRVNGGSLTNSNSLNAGSLIINSGSASLGGATTISGAATVNGGSLTNTGSLSADSLTINNGSATLGGSTSIGGATTVNGGSLAVNGSLNSAGLNINGGSTVISGTATMGGDASISGGSLEISGTLNTANLAISSNGSVDITSGGTANVSGVTSVGGSLHLDGVLNSSSVVLEQGNTLWGNGTINGQLSASGNMAPGNSIGCLHINGDASFSATSKLYAELSSDGCDEVSISGSLSIDGATLVTALPVDFYSNGQGWEIISADGGISGNFAEIEGQPDSETLSLSTVNYGQSLSVEVVRKSFGDFAASAGGKAAGQGLDGLIEQARDNDDTMADLLLTMDWTYSADQIQEAVEAMSPENYLAHTRAALAGADLFGQAASQRMAALRYARAMRQPESAQGEHILLAMAGDNPDINLGQAQAGEAPAGWSLWARMLTAWGEQDPEGMNLGYEQNLGGVAAGADGGLNSWLSAGFSLGYSQSELDWDNSAYDGDMTGLHAGLYAQADLGGFYSNLQAGFSRFDNEASRQVNFTDFSAKARADFLSYALQGRLEAGYQVRGNGWLLTPLAAMRYTHLYEDGFSESGADFLSLGVDDRETRSLAGQAGLRLDALLGGEGMSLVPRLGVFWLHEFLDDEPALQAHFRDYADTPFSLQGAEIDQDRALLEAGMELKFGGYFSASAVYNLELGDSYTCQSISAGINIWF